MDKYVLVVYHWRSNVNIFYVGAQLAGAYVSIGGCAIDMDIRIKDGGRR